MHSHQSNSSSNKVYLSTVLLCFYFSISFAQNNDSQHPRVYKTNLVNKYIDKDGVMLLYKTSHKQVFRATCYEFYNDRIYGTTLIFVTSKNIGDTKIYYRHQTNTNGFSQMFYRSDNLPLITSFDLAKNEIKEIVANGNIYRLYRNGEFIQLLAIKDMNGDIIFNINPN